VGGRVTEGSQVRPWITSCPPTPNPDSTRRCLFVFDQSETPSAVSLEVAAPQNRLKRDRCPEHTSQPVALQSSPGTFPFRISHTLSQRPRRLLPVNSFPGSSSGTRLPLFGSGGEFSALIHIWTRSGPFLLSKPRRDRILTFAFDIRTAEGTTTMASKNSSDICSLISFNG